MMPISRNASTAESRPDRQDLPSSRDAISRGIIHDLNNIFSSLTIATQLLRQELPEDRKDHLVESVVSATQRGRDLVEELGRHRTREPEEAIAFDPLIVIEAVARAARERFSGACALETVYDQGLPTVEGDPDGLFQRLYSLLETLCAQAPGGTLVMRSRLGRDGGAPASDGRSTVEIEIEHRNGSGPIALLPFVPPARSESDGAGVEVLRRGPNRWTLRLTPRLPRA